jgi:hypothetical protein
MYDVRPIDRATAEAIAGWRYDGRYSMYNGAVAAIEAFLKPEYQYYVFDENGDIVASATSVRMHALPDSPTTTMPSTPASGCGRI